MLSVGLVSFRICNEMLWYVLKRLCAITVWSIDISSNNAFHRSAGSDVFLLVLYWELSNYTCVHFDGSALNSAMICVLRIAASVGSIISSRVVDGKGHSFNEHGIF